MPQTDNPSGKVSQIAYRTDFLFEVTLDSGVDTYIADDTVNQTAIDVAMMRGVKVTLELDNGSLIRRVQSDVPAPGQPAPGTIPHSVTVTRVSTQRNGITGRMFCEVFFDDGTGEKTVKSFDPVIERLAGSSCIARQPIRLIPDPVDNGRLLGITKIAAPEK